MKRLPLLLILALLLGNSCQQQPIEAPRPEPEPLMTINDLPPPPDIFYPISDYESRLTSQRFGSQEAGRAQAWRVGDVLKAAENEYDEEIPVYAMADGKVVYRNWLEGYGGILILQHEREGQILQSLYGHIDLSQTVPGLGEWVRAGTLIAFLGDHESIENDRHPKQLSFALYPGSALKLEAFVENRSLTDNWINPLAYLNGQQALEPTRIMTMPEDWQRLDMSSLSPLYDFSLKIPADWKPVYQETNEAIAFIDESTEETMLFLRYFDASEFLTLSTVTIHERRLRNINGHEAVDYLIEKKPWVADFPDQPIWRNSKHQVTDIRAQDGSSRFYVFAQHPELDEKTAFYILESFALTTPEADE